MPQLSLYLDETTMGELRDRAEQRNTSLSKYVGSLLREDATSKWPEGFFDLYGSIDDDTFVRPPELDPSLDRPRPEL